MMTPRGMVRFPRELPLLLVLVLAMLPIVAFAQTTPDPVETARIRFGPLGFTPSISLTNLGVDGNVFNELDDPKQDFTLTVSPRFNSWFRAGRSRTAVTTRADLVYFHKYSGEGGVDFGVDGRFEVPGNRMTPWFEGSHSSGRQRIGYEIDLRSRSFTTKAALGVDARLSGKTMLTFWGRQTSYGFPEALFLGSNLREVLNHRTQDAGITYRYARTVLTTVVVEAETRRDVFEFSPQTNANTLRVQAGFDLGDQALVFGRVRLGYRKFDPVLRDLPRYVGVVASATTGFTLGNRTRVDLLVERDIQYSVSRTSPYYLQTGGMITVTPRLTEQWDFQLRGGGQILAYHDIESIGKNERREPRVDRHSVSGGGIGYHFGRDIRIGLNLDRQRRKSAIESHDYRNYAIWVSVTYGS